MYSHPKVEMAFLIIFTLLFAVIIISSNEKPSTAFFRAFKIGLGVTLVSLLMAWSYSRESIYNVATFKDYYFTGGFGKFYMLGLSILCAIPLAAVYKALDTFFLYLHNKPSNSSNDKDKR